LSSDAQPVDARELHEYMLCKLIRVGLVL